MRILLCAPFGRNVNAMYGHQYGELISASRGYGVGEGGKEKDVGGGGGGVFLPGSVSLFVFFLSSFSINLTNRQKCVLLCV